ncbi:YdeI family protein [Algoriphagus jejuensis]|uniref:YdeI family protein n=1 Tax=Algoriphagus jejuensis TaxID=419934 RepID=A0ABP3YIV1_9BACT
MDRDSLWKEEIEKLRSIIVKTELEESIKWGIPVYTHKGKNVVSAVGFKNYFSLWFYNGVFLSDPYQKLVNAQEGVTKALRHWRFESADEIDEEKILEYIHEAIRNEVAGKVWKPQKSGQLEIPEFFQHRLDADKNLQEAFDSLTPFKQKKFVEHLTTAKREATQLSRMEKIIPMILEGVGLNDKYR